MSGIKNVPSAAQRTRLGVTLGLLAFAQLIISIDYNIVYVALPQIGAELGFSAQTLQWVVSAYALAFGGFLLFGGRACDLLGARRVYLAGLALYAVGSLGGALAAGELAMIVARAVQGLGGALLFPAVLTLISTRFVDPGQRNRAFALWGTAGGGGMVLGSLLGGVLTQAFGWESVFYVNVPLALATIALSLWAIDPDPVRTGPRRSFDAAGSLASTIGVTALIYALVQGPEAGWYSTGVLLALGTGSVMLAAFVILEQRSADPLVPARLLRKRNLVAGMVVTALYMGSFGTLLYFLTVFFQQTQGFTALQTGMAFLIPMVGIAVGAQVGGRMVTRHGSRTVMMASMALGVLGALLLALALQPDATYVALIPGLLILGLGQGSGWTVMFAGATDGIPGADQGIASAMASTTQQLGGAAGLAVLVAIANHAAGSSALGAAHGAATGARVAVLAATIGIVGTLLAASAFTGKASAESRQPQHEEVTA